MNLVLRSICKESKLESECILISSNSFISFDSTITFKLINFFLLNVYNLQRIILYCVLIKMNDYTSNEATVNKDKYLLIPFLILLFGVLLIRCAWIGDDAYITFRTIDNFVNGYGLTWNVAERVQTYTSPLWMLLLSVFYFFTREIYFTSTFVSIAISILTLLIVAFKIANSKALAILSIVVLILSKAFVDYSASGLENPLIHLVLCVFLWVYLKSESNTRTLFYLFLYATLAGLTRMDTLVLYIPILIFSFWNTKAKLKEKLLAAFKGSLPFIIWELFSLFYYGFLFPNTAYAKLNTGIEKIELMKQGICYLINSISIDPITLLVIISALVTAILSKEKKYLVIGGSLLLFLIYVISIGGDFMSGRFLTAPLVFSVAFLSCYFTVSSKSQEQIFVIILFLLLISLNPLYSPLFSNVDYGKKHEYTIDEKGTCDERAHYYQSAGLLKATRSFKLPSHLLVDDGKRDGMYSATKVIYNVGYYGFYAGPKLHIIDVNALTDPLLARLPCIKENWRIGHFVRNIPDGYFETVSSGGNQIRDRNLAAYYDKLSFIIRGNLFNTKRLVEIWNTNIGKYNQLLNSPSSLMYVTLGSLTAPKSEGSPWNSPDNIQFHDSGIEINLENLYHSNSIEVSLDHNDTYKIIYLINNSEVDNGVIEGNKFSIKEGLAVYSVEVPSRAQANGFNSIKIIPMQGDGMYSIGHIKLLT